MLPRNFKNTVFDKISAVTMRKYFHPVNLGNSEGLIREVLIQSQKDFFINGTITCHSASPEHMAGLWMAGREIALTNGHLPAWLKKAMGAALSEINKCPYCEDMLLSLTYGANERNLANALKVNGLNQIEDETTRKRIKWVKASQYRHSDTLRASPFTEEQMPEALGTLIVFGYTNKMSDFALDGSPVPSLGRGVSLKLFGVELRESTEMDLSPGVSLDLLPEGHVPDDLAWSLSNPLVASSLSRWNKVLEEGISDVLSPETQNCLRENLLNWVGGPVPLSRSWVEEDVRRVPAPERHKARLALLVAKASYQIEDSLIQQLVEDGMSESDLIKLGAWSAFLGAKAVANWCWEAHASANLTNENNTAIV